MNFINKDLFGIIVENKSGNAKNPHDQVALYAIASPKKFSINNKYNEFMKKVSDITGPFINMRFKGYRPDNADYSDIPVFAYKHVNKGNPTCWITTDHTSDIFRHAELNWHTYFIAIPYKQRIASIKCEPGVEILKVSTRTYGKVHNARGQFDWRDPSIEYKKDDSRGQHYNKVLYMIVNVEIDCKDPTITIDEVKIPAYQIKKDVEANNVKETYNVTHNEIKMTIPYYDCPPENENFYPQDNVRQVKERFAVVNAMLDDKNNVPLMDLITQTPIETETY